MAEITKNRRKMMKEFRRLMKESDVGTTKLMDKNPQGGVFFRMMLNTTQSAHVLMIIAVMSVIMVLHPKMSQGIVARTFAMKMIYVSSLATHFGAQMWMTFVSGISLYYSIPRHTFGQVQKVLFPKYFGYNSILSFVTLMAFVSIHSSKTWDNIFMSQIGSMVLCFFVEVVIYLYRAPPLLKLIAEKTAMEMASGVGMEIGRHDPGILVKCSHYMRLHKAFRKAHMVTAIGNITSMACVLWNLYYLASNI